MRANQPDLYDPGDLDYIFQTARTHSGAGSFPSTASFAAGENPTLFRLQRLAALATVTPQDAQALQATYNVYRLELSTNEDPAKPCRLSQPTIKKVGYGETDSMGRFHITFTPTEPFEGACAESICAAPTACARTYAVERI